MDYYKLLETIRLNEEMFADKESKDIYKGVLLFNLTNQYKYLYGFLSKYRKELSICRLIERNTPIQKDDIIIFGAGVLGRKTLDWLLEFGLKISCFYDNNERIQGTVIGGVEVKKPIFKNSKNIHYVVAAMDGVEKEITNQLLEEGIFESNISLTLQSIGQQYFEKDILGEYITEEEVFIDGGCFNGDSCCAFSEWLGGKYKKIYAFEPDKGHFKEAQECFKNKNIKNIELFPFGLWDKKESIQFSIKSGGASCFDPTGYFKIESTSIDEVLLGGRVSFIKLDVEGAELKALKGAEKTIKKYKPKLAVCVYHKSEDLIVIPQYIKLICPEYKFYLRHYTSLKYETVLYCV